MTWRLAGADGVVVGALAVSARQKVGLMSRHELCGICSAAQEASTHRAAGAARQDVEHMLSTRWLRGAAHSTKISNVGGALAQRCALEPKEERTCGWKLLHSSSA